jgi:hypothetical protein
MADVAQLGLAVDSSQVKSATAALNQLNAAAGSAAAGASTLAASGAKSDTVLRAIEASAKRSGLSVAEMTARVDATSAAHNKMVTASNSAQKALVSLSTQARQAANDNGTLTKATDSSGVSLEKLGNILTRRVLFAFAAKQIRDLAAYIWGLNAAIATTADTAGRVGVSGSRFQGLTTAAAYQGVTGDQFNAGMLAFNQQVDLAKNGLGTLQILLKANGKTVSDTATTFGMVADLVKNAGSEAQKFSILQQAGLPATREFARLMEQGGAAIGKQADAAHKLTQQQLEDAKRINDAWQQGWVDFENWGKRAVVNTFGAIGSIAGALRAQGEALYGPGGAYGPKRAGAAGDWMGIGAPAGSVTRGSDLSAPKRDATVDVELQKQLNTQAQARLSILGPLATVEQQVRQKELELAAAGMNLTGVNRQQHDALINLTRAQAEMNQVGTQAQIGVFRLRDATAQAGHELQSWIDRKLLDPTNPREMAAALEMQAKRTEQLGQSALVAAAPLEGLQRLANEVGSVRTQMDQFATTSVNAITPALRDMLNGTTSLSAGFRALGTTIVSAMQDAIIKLLIIKPLISGLTSSFGLGSVLGLGGRGSNATDGIGGFGPTFAAADGGTFGPGWGVVGERGPELIKVHGGAVTVIPNHISRPYLPGFAEGGMLSSNGNVSRFPVQHGGGSITYNIDASGADSGTVERIRKVLDHHTKAIGSQGRAMRSAQRMQATGVS